MFTIPKKAYQKARRKLARSERYWDKHAEGKKGGPRALDAKKYPNDPATNRDRSVVEVYEFRNRKQAAPFVGYLDGKKITNWTGLRLCTVTSRTEGRRGFYGSKITSVQARCIDGRRYVGTSPGDGMYARMRPAKGR